MKHVEMNASTRARCIELQTLAAHSARSVTHWLTSDIEIHEWDKIEHAAALIDMQRCAAANYAKARAILSDD